MPKSSRKIKMSQKQKQSTKQSVIVNVKNVINERRRRAKPAPAPKKETRDTVMLQPKASMFGNNLLTGNVSRYVQPAMSFAVAPPQFQPIQSAIVDKPIAKVVPPKQQPDVFAGEETNPNDIVPSYTPKPAPDLPDSYVPRVGDLAVASASSSGFRFTPQPPPPPSQPAEYMGPAQAFGAPAVPVAEAIAGEEKDEVDPIPVAPPPPVLTESTLKQYIKEGRFDWDTFDRSLIPILPKLKQIALQQLVNSYRSQPSDAELNTLAKEIIKVVKIQPGMEPPIIQKKK